MSEGKNPMGVWFDITEHGAKMKRQFIDYEAYMVMRTENEMLKNRIKTLAIQSQILIDELKLRVAHYEGSNIEK